MTEKPLTKEELKKLAVTVLGPAWKVELVDEADVIQDGIRHQHIRGKTTGPHGERGQLDVIQEVAAENPGLFGFPWWQVGAGAAILGVGSFALWRILTRNKLAGMLRDSALMAEATKRGLINWTPESKAAVVIGWVGLTTAQQGFLIVMDELRILMPEAAQSPASVALDAALAAGFTREEFETGKLKMEEVYANLPNVPGVDTTRLFNWFTGKGS